jgi:hypothetical protein
MTTKPLTKPEDTGEPMRGSVHEAAVERLIELAADEKPAAKPGELLALEAPKGGDRSSMWKALGQLKAVLPYLSRLLPLIDARFLPLLELVGAGHTHNAGVSKEIREGVAGLQTDQRELRTSVQNQALEIEQLEAQVTQLREAFEMKNLEHATLIENVTALGRLVRWMGAGLAVLLVLLSLICGVLLARFRH